MYRDIVLYNCTNELVQLLDKERDFMYSDFALRTVLYTILCIGAIGISTGKLFAINHGISKYLAKKSDSGNFKTVKTTFISLGIEYVSIAIIALFISLCTINTIYTNAFFDELLPEFFSTAVTVFAIVVLGAECDFGLWLLFAIPYTFLIIANILILFFVNYKFVYKDFEVSKNKKMKLSFFTALANAPYELLIPYGQFGTMIFKSMI